MTKLLSVIVAALFAAASATAIAQDKPKAEAKKAPSAAQKKQQERMKQCNAQADEKKMKGDDRKKFMSSCLKPPAKKAEGAKAAPKSAETKKAEPKK